MPIMEKAQNELLDFALQTFVGMLRKCIPDIQKLGSKVGWLDLSEFKYNWLEASWEMLVETSVCTPDNPVYLEPYGEGAELNDRGSRVWQVSGGPTHAVHCHPIHGKNLIDKLTGNTIDFPVNGLRFEEFVTLSEDGWHLAEPPFDHVLVLRNGFDTVFTLADVRFSLEPV